MINAQLDAQIKAYILAAIENPDDDTLDDAGKLAWVKACFISEYCFPDNLRRFPNEQVRLAEWLAGLPTGIDIAFSNHDIVMLAEKWGTLAPNASDDDCYNVIEKWFSLCAAKLLQLFTLYGV